MVARIRAVHRRLLPVQSVAVEAERASVPVMVGAVRVDLHARSVTGRGGEPIRLTAAEFEALGVLIRSAPQPVSREQLCRLALRRPFHAEDRGVDQLVLSLRRKLFGDASALNVIVSVRSAGYAIIVEKHLPVAQAAA